MQKGSSVRDNDVRDEPIPLAQAAEMCGVSWRTVPSWMNPAGSQGCSRRTFGAFDTRQLNPVLNDEVGRNYSLR
jgi:hypothetical protein